MATEALMNWTTCPSSRSPPPSLRLSFLSAFQPTLRLPSLPHGSVRDGSELSSSTKKCRVRMSSYPTPRLPGTPLSTRTPAWIKVPKRVHPQHSIPKEPRFKSESQLLWEERETAIGTDVFLVPRTGEMIAAHRTVLMFTSPVFRKYLAIDVPIGKRLEIKMKDFSDRVILQFLKFLYLQDLPEEAMQDTAVQLWGMAHKYMVPHLKDVVEGKVGSCLTVDNVICNTMRADSYNARVIEEACLSFIVENKKVLGYRSDFQILPNHLKLQLLEMLMQEA